MEQTLRISSLHGARRSQAELRGFQYQWFASVWYLIKPVKPLPFQRCYKIQLCTPWRVRKSNWYFWDGCGMSFSSPLPSLPVFSGSQSISSLYLLRKAPMPQSYPPSELTFLQEAFHGHPHFTVTMICVILGKY